MIDRISAVVLLSGGLDSATVLHQAIADGVQDIHAVSFRYGSQHEERELDAAANVARWADANWEEGIVTHEIISMPRIFAGGKSAVMGDSPMPMEEYRNYEGGEGESITVVPFRNANLLAAATTIAEVAVRELVYAGMHATDHGTWAYPDCSPEFLGSFASCVFVGTNQRVRLRFPFLWMTKADVVTRASVLGVPVYLTYSCYMGGVNHCGTCPTCLERIKAFEEAGFRDPVTYDNRPDTHSAMERWG